MSFSTTQSKALYVGNGTVSDYTVPFLFQTNSDLQVKVRNDLGTVTTTLVLNTDYLVSGAGDLSGGQIQLQDLGQDWIVTGNLKSDYEILIRRDPSITQQTDFRNAGRFFAETHEDRFDRQTFIDQKINEVVERGVYFDEFSSGYVGQLPEPQNGFYLTWDGVTGKLKNSSGTVDPLAQTSLEVIHDPSDSTLAAVNVKAGLDELAIRTDNLAAADIVIEADITAIEADITALESQATTTILPALNPTGAILMWALGASAPPSGYLYCNGQAVSRATFSTLFAAISTIYGSGDGSTTFNVPNFQGLVPRGIGSQVVEGLSKVGPSLGATQRDQMQRITGSVTGVQLRNSATRTDAGALTSTAASSTTAGLNTNTQNILTGFAFDSSASPDVRVSATTEGETTVASLGIGFIIKT